LSSATLKFFVLLFSFAAAWTCSVVGGASGGMSSCCKTPSYAGLYMFWDWVPPYSPGIVESLDIKLVKYGHDCIEPGNGNETPSDDIMGEET
jgi:hypothetical protein